MIRPIFIYLLSCVAAAAHGQSIDQCEADLPSGAAHAGRVARAAEAVRQARSIWTDGLPVPKAGPILVGTAAAIISDPVAEVRDHFLAARGHLIGSKLETWDDLALVAQYVILAGMAPAATPEPLARAIELHRQWPASVDAHARLGLTKLTLLYDRTPDEVAADFEDVRRRSRAAERRLRERRAAVQQNHPDAPAGAPWFTDEILLAITEAAIAAHVPSADALLVAENFFSDDLATICTPTAREAIIKAAVVLGRPVGESLARLMELRYRVHGRVGRPVDESVAPTLNYAVLLADVPVGDVIEFWDHAVRADPKFKSPEAYGALYAMVLAVAANAPRPDLVRAALINAYW